MILRSRSSFSPFASRGRRTIAAILLTFALFGVVSVVVSVRSVRRSQHQATVVEVAARQRSLAARYVQEVILARQGEAADPARIATLLAQSSQVLLDGGEAPAVEGDDDGTTIMRVTDPQVRQQLQQEQRLVSDLTRTGAAYLADRPLETVHLTAHERIGLDDPILRLRVLSALTSNVALNSARAIAVNSDRRLGSLITLQAALGGVGILMSLLLGWALISTARRQTAHFRSLVTSSTDLVLVWGDGACRYASKSVTDTLGLSEEEILGYGFFGKVHPTDRTALHGACTTAQPHELRFRIRNRQDEWRYLEAHVTDLRSERHVRGVVLNARDVTERVRLEEELTRQVFQDVLTGLANRALFRHQLDHALARARRSGRGFSVLLLDLDEFKQVNDSLGHSAGDQLLQEAAARFSAVIRPGDTLARLGGDEFAVLLDDVGEDVVTGIAERLLAGLEAPFTIAGHELALGASIGIALHTGGNEGSEDLIRHADLAMYAAKEAGRGQYELFKDDMARALGELIGLEHELRQGLQRGEFTIHYQPEVDLATRGVVGAEALARWSSPSRGLVPAERFIRVLESTGLVLELGAVVLASACEQTAAWDRDHVLPDGFVTWVNISGRHLSAGGVSSLVRRTLSRTGLAAQRLGLEVTETALVLDSVAGERARAALQELRELGVRIAIDDFGTGFSSLGHLREFPVDVIKIDRSFVQGIESEEQLASVRELGCDIGQGYLFAEPAPAEELARLLAGPEVTPLRASA